eukprot:2638273-Prymnesium_polylepis.1
MHFLSLAEYNVGLARPLDAVLTPFAFWLSVHIHTSPIPFPNAHEDMISGGFGAAPPQGHAHVPMPEATTLASTARHVRLYSLLTQCR